MAEYGYIGSGLGGELSEQQYAARQQQVQQHFGGQSNQLQKDSLASISPRVLNRVLSVAQFAAEIERAFGISSPTKAESSPRPEQPTLMSALQQMDAILSETCVRLENIQRHVNG